MEQGRRGMVLGVWLAMLWWGWCLTCLHVLLGAADAATEEEIAALTALYHATNGPGWYDNTNWLVGDPCEPGAEWYGVRLCSAGHPVELFLYYNALSGTIPPEIGDLVSLNRLRIGDNALSGTIPPEIGDLINLNSLWLDNNAFTGVHPRLCELRLSTVYLEPNAFSCPPPDCVVAKGWVAPCTSTCYDSTWNGDATGVDSGGSCDGTCSDGVRNGNEEGADCGGSCAACPTCRDGERNGDEEGADCGGSCVVCVGDEDLLPYWGAVLIAVSGLLTVVALIVTGVCVVRRRRRRIHGVDEKAMDEELLQDDRLDQCAGSGDQSIEGFPVLSSSRIPAAVAIDVQGRELEGRGAEVAARMQREGAVLERRGAEAVAATEAGTQRAQLEGQKTDVAAEGRRRREGMGREGSGAVARDPAVGGPTAVMEGGTSALFKLLSICPPHPSLTLEDAMEPLVGQEYQKFVEGERWVGAVLRREDFEPDVMLCKSMAADQIRDTRLAGVGVEGLAAIRLISCECVYACIHHLLRNPARTRESVEPVRLYMWLVINGLHALPAEFVYEGPAYRGEKSVHPQFGDKFKRGDTVYFNALTSFMRPGCGALRRFTRRSGSRTLIKARWVRGFLLRELSDVPDEEEVLVEPMSGWEVNEASNIGLVGEFGEGLSAAGVEMAVEEGAGTEGLHLVVLTYQKTHTLMGQVVVHKPSV